MYAKGELELVTAADLDDLYGPPEADEGPHTVSDSRGASVAPPVVQLPHSCDAWVIGGLAAVDALIADLLAVRDKLR